MNIKWLKTFIVTAQHENFRKASEILFLTQPAVSKHIQRLEDYLQCSLFSRKGKQVLLNAEGHRFLPIAQKILKEYEIGLHHFEAWQCGYTKQLSIAVAPQIASSILPAILKDFMIKESKIEILIDVVNSYEVVQKIVEGKADIGLTCTYPSQSNLKSEIVLEEPVVLVAPYDTQIEHEKNLFEQYRLITHNHPVYWDDLLLEIMHVYPMIKTLKVNQIEVSKKFIEKGLGVSYLPYSMVEKEIAEHLLKVIPPAEIETPISHTYLVTKISTSEMETFINFFKDALKK